MKHLIIFFTFTFIFFNIPALSLTVDEIKQKIIESSIQGYSGKCTCPYSLKSNGRRCGKMSAYSKKGGYVPVCYPSDVTPEMIERYRKRFN